MSDVARAEPNAALEAVLELHRMYNAVIVKGDGFATAVVGVAICRVMIRLQAILPAEEWTELTDLATVQEPLRTLPLSDGAAPKPGA